MSTPSGAFDLFRVPVIGGFLRWRHARTVVSVPLLLIAIVMIAHGLAGPDLAPRNLATVLTWIHFRGALVLVLLVAGNFFCMACPFMLVRQAARKVFRPRWNWPRRLRNKWLSIGLIGLILFAYELFDLWSAPRWTALLILAYFAAIVAVDSLFKHAAFCKFVCPIGQFNFIAATVSPFEVKVRERAVCARCRTTDCIRGRRDPERPPMVVQRGCELALFQPYKAGNIDCTFCLECVNACPHDNIGILGRAPAEELTEDPRRSGVGFLSRRRDVAALGVVFTFGALLNAFGMVSPVYVFERWIAGLLNVASEAPVLAVITTLFLVAEPVVLLGLAAWISRRSSGTSRGLLPVAVRYSYALIPIGFGMWLAHYGFHFFTGIYTIIPVAQDAAAGLLGQPRWTLAGLPLRLVQPLELGFLLLGTIGSLVIAYRLAEEDSPDHPMRTFSPWAAVCLLLLAAAVWLVRQPMEMRSIFTG